MPRRGENIRKRKDGRWEARFPVGTDEKGRKRYSSVYADSYREVKEKRNAAIQRLNTQLKEPSGDPLYKDIIQLWIEHNRVRLKEATVYRYMYLIEAHILPSLGDVPLSSINSAVINSFVTEKVTSGRLDGKGGLSSTYIRSIILIISSTIKFAAENGFCTSVSRKIVMPPVKSHELDILSTADQEKLEHALLHDMDETKLGVYISLYTGLRIGEICALSWEDIDLSNGLLYVRHTLSRVLCEENGKQRTVLIIDQPKTQSSLRKIPINSDLLRTLNEMYPKAESRYVVSNHASFVSPRTYEYRYCKILQESGIHHINYHALRHTFATRCIEVGVDIKSLSEILGHSNVSITLNTYVHSSMDLKRSQLEKLTAISV